MQYNKILVFLVFNETYLVMMANLQTVLEENFFVNQLKTFTVPT